MLIRATEDRMWASSMQKLYFFRQWNTAHTIMKRLKASILHFFSNQLITKRTCLQCRDPSWILLGWGKIPWEGIAPLQHSWLENPHGQRYLVDYNPWGWKKSYAAEQLSTAHESGANLFLKLLMRKCLKTITVWCDSTLNTHLCQICTHPTYSIYHLFITHWVVIGPWAGGS